MIVVGDIHAKSKEPFYSAIKSFFKWLIENYKNEEIVFLGDIFDTSSPHGEIEKEIINLISQFKHSHLITGNHDRSNIKGNTLIPHVLHDNISVYEDATEVIIDNVKCFMLPFRNNDQEYPILAGRYDYIFTHITPVEVQFANEGIKFPNLEGIFIHGHTHIQSEFIDEYGHKHYVLGVPIETRHLEAQKHKIVEISSNKEMTFIDVPFYFTHETVEYGEEPTSKNNILNIINAPNKKLVYEKYSNYYIRDNGITILRTEASKEVFKTSFEKSNILQKFKFYAQDKGLSQEVITECSQRLSKII